MRLWLFIFLALFGLGVRGSAQVIHYGTPVVEGLNLPLAPEILPMDADEEIVTRILLGEARGERSTAKQIYPRVVNDSVSDVSIIGLQAVANVIYNRSLTRQQPFWIVCTAPGQFEAFTPPLTELPPLLVFQARWLAREMMDNKLPDVTEGATHFYSGDVPAWWSKTMRPTVTIGRHHFFREVRVLPRAKF